MRDRYQKEQDLPLAERWLENYLLTRKQADSRQLLHTTRLTDLIYQGFAAQQPINRFSSDRNTPDMESWQKTCLPRSIRQSSVVRMKTL